MRDYRIIFIMIILYLHIDAFTYINLLTTDILFVGVITPSSANALFLKNGSMTIEFIS